MTPRNLGDLLKNTVRRVPDKKAFLYKEGGRYTSIGWSEVGARVERLAAALDRQGLKRGDRLAILSENRCEWALTDLAAQTLGVATVPIYTSLAAAEIQYILNDCGASAVAVSQKALFERSSSVHRQLPALRFVIGFDASLSLLRSEIGSPLLTLKELEGPEKEGSFHAADVDPESVASIIYTSGTTGSPKGVMLTHSNLIANAIYCKKAFKMSESDRHLSFLPLSHIFERLAGYYLMVYIGAEIAYAESMDTVPQNLIEARPTFVLGVPRFYEKIRDRILEAMEKASPARAALFHWARRLGQKRRKAAENSQKLGLGFALQYSLAEKLVYHKVRARLGGRVRFCVAGGAALPKETAEFFYDLGVMIYEGYGLTETSPVMSANREEHWRFGTVGVPLDEVSVKIAEDGEVLTKSKCVMKGYYGKPEQTAEVIRDGWFHTGDLGKIDKSGFLSITGRKKEVLITSSGKKITPRVVEELMEGDPLILRCVLFGEGRNYLTALIVPAKEKLLEYAELHKTAHRSYTELLQNPAIREFIAGRLEARSGNLANFERIKSFVLLENDFSQAAGELTPTLKIKRNVVLSRHKEELLALYGTHAR